MNIIIIIIIIVRSRSSSYTTVGTCKAKAANRETGQENNTQRVVNNHVSNLHLISSLETNKTHSELIPTLALPPGAGERNSIHVELAKPNASDESQVNI